MSTIFTSERFPWLKGARCLVTGGAGFIGSHVSQRLLELGAKVTILDDFSTGLEANLPKGPGKAIKGSVTSKENVQAAVKNQEYVFHLAAIPAVPRSIEKPADTAFVNIWGTQMVLEESRLAKVKRVIYSASSSAYGATKGEFPRTEDLPPLPLSPYASQKLAGEFLCRAYALSLGVDTISLRYFNIFGPRQNPESAYAAVIPKFITKALANETITIFGDGSQKRDFTYVDNAVYANLLASNPSKRTGGETVNIGCGTTFSLNNLTTEIEALLQRKISVDNQSVRAGDVSFSQASIEKAKKLIGYEPLVPFKAGLESLFGFLKSRRQISL